MIEFFASVVGIYFIFKGLDYLFSRRRPTQLKEGDFIQKIGDAYFVVSGAPEKVEPEQEVKVPHKRSPRLRIVR